MELTKEEKNAFTALQRLAARWPETLWLISSRGTLSVMKYKDKKKAAMVGMSFDPEYKVADLDIPLDMEEW